MANQNSPESKPLAHQLHSTAIHLLRKLRREDAGSGLNAPRLSALSVVVFGGPMTLGDLAAVEQVRPPTMTRIVNALGQKKLLRKAKNPRDGRHTLILPTARGRKLLMRARERRVRAVAAEIERLTLNERIALNEAVQILDAMIRRI